MADAVDAEDIEPPEFAEGELERQEEENLERFRELLREIPRG